MEVITILFIITSIIIILTPGQDMILVMSRSIAQGQKAGVMTALGVSVGLMGHTILTALGGSESSQLFILGTTFAVLTFFMKASIGLISGALSFWIKARPMVLKYINRTSGIILIGLGLKLATSEKV